MPLAAEHVSNDGVNLDRVDPVNIHEPLTDKARLRPYLTERIGPSVAMTML